MPAEEIHEWLSRQPLWLHLAADRLCNGEGVSSSLVVDSVETLLCGRDDTPERPQSVRLSAYDLCADDKLTRIVSINDAVGVNRIKPHSTLAFGSTPLTIVYGNNGAGKSGYVRLLKIAAGRARFNSVLPNVFSATSEPAHWSLTATCDGTESTFTFSEASGHGSLSSLQVFDEELAEEYRVSARELSFEPPVLSLFDDLVSLADAMAREIEARKAQLPSKLPAMPVHLRQEGDPAQYFRASGFKSRDAIAATFTFSENDAAELADTERKNSLAKSPEAIERQRRRVAAGRTLHAALITVFSACFTETETRLAALRSEVARSQVVLKAASDLAAGGSDLQGFGTESWMGLWTAAKTYSEEWAYPDSGYPNLNEGALCVLCQQELSGAARTRFHNFDKFVLGAANLALQKADLALQAAVRELPADSVVDDVFDKILETEGLTIADPCMAEASRSVKERLSQLRIGGTPTACPANLPKIALAIQKHCETLKADLDLAESPAEVAGRKALQARIKALQSQKWKAEQLDAMIAEWDRVGLVRALEAARLKCNTAEITVQKTRLSERLITAKVTERFREELSALKAKKLPVTFKMSKGQKGKVLHRTAVDGATRPTNPNDVLSEGERRVLALSAFLADTTTAENRSPFIFDDPVSSLDHTFEAAVAARLANLAKSRQVIVFTHRLSFAFQVEAAGKKRGISVGKIGLKSDHVDAGIQGDFPTDKDPKALANTIINECPKLRKDTIGLSDAEARLKLLGAFAAMRRAVERAVEKVLLTEIVKRFDPAIHTDNGLTNLTKITRADCILIERLMGAYSLEIHDQSDELDNAPMDVDQLESDARELVQWIEEFKKRTPSA